MDITKLYPILNKESILKTANARELGQAPQDVLERYRTYALTHIPLGNTTKQLKDLERVIAENKHCAIGAIVGPYGYGKTSTSVHLWNELREEKFIAVPPFLWANLSELMDAVYYWLKFEISQGPKDFLRPLEALYERYCQSHKEEYFQKIDADYAQELIDKGLLRLEIRPEDVVAFFQGTSDICEQAGYNGLVIFTDELQATLAGYKPSRDEFFAHLFQIVKDIQGLEGRWALVISMDDDTEGMLSLRRKDILTRMQRSALYFRVKDVYNRREYPAELWSAFEKRFSFDGNEVISSYTLDSIGQIAARPDLGAGPRMVTLALALAIKSYEKTGQQYTPLQFADDFLEGLVSFDQQGKLPTAIKKALANNLVRGDEAHKQVIKLLAAYPLGCSEETLNAFDLLEDFQNFPPVARRELIVQVSGGYTLSSLAEESVASESIAQRLTTDFVNGFAPGKTYAARAAEALFEQVIIEQVLSGWKSEKGKEVEIGGVKYQSRLLHGSVDNNYYPGRCIAVMVAAVQTSPSPIWQKLFDEAHIELRFELNYNVPPGEPSRLVVSPDKAHIAVFQLNVMAVNQAKAISTLPRYLFDYYMPERWNPLLTLSLMEHLWRHKGDSPDEQQRMSAAIAPLRQYALQVLLGEQLETTPPDFMSQMVGVDRIKDLLKKQCQQLYPSYRTLMTTTKWLDNLQLYNNALQRLMSQDDLSIVRGRQPWKATKEEVADTFAIPGKRLTNLEPLLDSLKDLIIKADFSGRTSQSTVTLQFRLHPLEEEWLKLLEESQETLKHNGLDVPCLPHELPLRQAATKGYTNQESGEILRLLKQRGFIDFDQNRRLLFRTVEAIDDQRENLREQLQNLESQMQKLAEALPDFESDRFSLGKLRSMLEEAKERDQLEEVKIEIRRMKSSISTFSSNRKTKLQDSIREEIEKLHNLVRQGIPPWLRNSFESGPLQNLLEKQRTGLTEDYQAQLDEIRQLYEQARNDARTLPSEYIEGAIASYTLLQELSKQSKRLTTHLDSHRERQDSFESWRKVSRLAVEVEREALSISQVYGNAQPKQDIEELWNKLYSRFEAQPFTFLNSHKAVHKEIDVQKQQMTHWLEGRREDFEKQRKLYEELLATVHIEVALRVPFDRDRPKESQTTLVALVLHHLHKQFTALEAQLKNALQTIRYSIQVQKLELSEAEVRANKSLDAATSIKEQISSEIISDSNRFQRDLLTPLLSLIEEEKSLEMEVQRAIQQRPAEGSELKLMQLFQANNAGHEVDLHELIMQLIDQGTESVNLDALMHDLESLFQKNLIDIRIKPITL